MRDANANLVTWTDDLSVDGLVIDDDHRFLVSLINELQAIIRDGSHTDLVSGVLCELADYAGRHFLREERLMALHHYPDRESHILEHWKFIDKLTHFTAAMERGHLIAADVLRFLMLWIGHHLRNDDASFGHFLNARTRAGRHHPRERQRDRGRSNRGVRAA